MKTILTLVLFGMMITNQSYSFDKQRLTVYDDTAKIIEQIRKEYISVNTNQPKDLLFEKDLITESTEGGFIAAFYDQRDLKKIVATYYGETGKSITEYYLNSDKLFFVFVKEYHYNKPTDQPGSKIEYIKENRYYFYNKKLIRWLQGSKIQNPNLVTYKNESAKFLSEWLKLTSYMAADCHTAMVKASRQDTVRCKYGSDCPSTGYILKGSRNACGEAIHVSPKNKKLPLEQ